MRRLYFFLAAAFCVVVISATAWGQTATDGDYRSIATGNWDGATTWQVRSGGSWAGTATAPTSANNVYIQTGHTVTVNVGTAACKDFHQHTGGVTAIGANTLQVNGKIRAYTGAAVITAGADGTFYSGQTSSTSPGANSITSTGAGKLSFVGNTRSITVTGEWGATLTGAAFEIALTSGQTATPNTNMKAASWNFASGIFDASTVARVISADNGTTGGPVTIASGTNVLSAGLPSFQRTGATSGSTLTVAAGGTLTLTAASPTIAMTTLVFNGTVEYSRAGAQTFANAVQGGSIPLTYTNIKLSGSGAKTTLASQTTSIAANGSLEMSGGATPPTLAVGTSGTFSVSSTGTTISYTATGAQTTGTEWVANFQNATINNSAGVTLGGSKTLNGTLTLTTGDLNTGSNTLTMPAAATSAGTTDVVGNVLRTGFVTGGSALSFGNPFNTIAVTADTAPANILVNLVKGSPGDFANAVRRTYTITPSGGGFTGTLQLHYNDSELNLNSEASLVLWRNDAGTWNNQGGTVTDDTVGDNNFVQLAGVTQFSPWTVAGPSAPTAVRLTKFNAASYADGVQLSWESGYEVNNLGYHLYREQKGQRTRVTPAVVAGSALTVGPGSRLTAGYSYSWFDQKGTADTAYYLEAIDLNGTRQWTGPIYPYAGTSKSVSPRQARALLLSELAAASTANSVTSEGLSGSLSNFEAWPTAMKNPARSETIKVSPAGLAVQQAIAGGKAVKIQVNRTGWYRLSQPELVAAGFDPSSDARLLQLYLDGAEVPIELSSNGARLNTNDTLEFYGVGLDTPTTDTRTYWLVNGSSAGKRISAKRGKVKPGEQNWTDGTTTGSFLYTTERREKLLYSSHLLNGDADNIFGAPVLSEPINQTLTVSKLDRDSSSQPQLEVALQGLTVQGHEVQVQFNGADVGTITFTGVEHPIAKFNVNRALLRDGDNQVSLVAINGDSDISFVDSIRLTYAHQYRADNNALGFSVPGGQTVRVSGFTSPNVRVIDVTNPSAPLEVATTAGLSQGGYAVTVQTSGNEVRTLVAFTDDLARHPASLRANNPSRWHSSANGANIVIITHKDFAQAIEPLAALRRSQGLGVAVVDVEDVYDEFSYGAHTPAALKAFLSCAAGNWRRKPGYLLLVGR